MKLAITVVIVVLLSNLSSLMGQTPTTAIDPLRPKYGSSAIRLFDSREFIQQSPAPDFWALMPYYVGQPNDSTCSVASVAMVVNALRVREKLRADQSLVRPSDVLECCKAEPWADKLRDHGDGVTLDEFVEIVPMVLKALHLPDTLVQVIRLPEDPAQALVQMRELLAANEKSDRDLVIANFLQSTLTDDPEGAVGHMAPIGAYDAKSQRVLIMDPDRTWYEPYWSPDTALLQAVHTMDPVSGRRRGLIRISHLLP